MKLTVLLILIINLSLSAQQTAIEYSRYSDKVAVNTVSSILPDSIFNYVISKLGILDFSDCNNCDSRAHITAKVIEKQFPGSEFVRRGYSLTTRELPELGSTLTKKMII